MTFKSRLRFVREEQFHQLFQRSAFLAREFLGQLESHRFENSESGSKICYVFDTSVLSALSAPWVVGPLQGRSRHGLGQLLPRMFQIRTEVGFDEDDQRTLRMQRAAEDRLAIRVTELLAKAAVEAAYQSRFNKPVGVDVTKAPLWQLSAHHDETNAVRRALVRRVEGLQGSITLQSEDKRRAHTKQFVVMALKSWAARGERHRIRDFLDYLVDEIMSREMLSGFGVASQSANLNSFTRSAFNFEELSEFRIPGLDALLGEPLSEMERVAQEFLESYWTERLQRKFQAAASDNSRVRRDAQALAELAVLNRRILDHGINLRVVLVTGDRNLVEASYNGSDRIETSLDDNTGRLYGRGDYSEYRRRSECLQEFFLRVSGANSERAGWFDRFSLNYVRHLHAFAHDEIAEGEQTEGVFGFLSGFFAETASSILQDRGLLEEIALGRSAEKPPAGFRESFLETIENWDLLARRKVKESRFSSWNTLGPEAEKHLLEIVSDDLNRLSADKVDDTHTFEMAAIWTAEYVDRTRDQTMLHFSNLGTDILQGGDGGWIVRNPPDLHFSNLPKCMEIFRKLSSRHGYGGGNKDAFHRDFEAIVEDVPVDQREDGRLQSHLQFLALSAAFAAADKWSVAESHAQRALAILDRASLHNVIPSIAPILDQKGGLVCQISGREARFLSAVCKRMRAEDDTDLDVAEVELSKARTALISDRDAEERILSESILELRHDAEWMSIELSRYYLLRSECRNAFCVNNSEEIACEKCRNSRDRLFEQARKVYSVANLAGMSAPTPSLSGLALATNVVQLNVIRAYWERQGPDGHGMQPTEWMEDETLLHALKLLKEVQAQKQFVFNSIAQAYLEVGLFVAHRRGLEIDDSPSVDDAERAIARLRNHLVTSYDAWRFWRIRKFLERERKLMKSGQP